MKKFLIYSLTFIVGVGLYSCNSDKQYRVSSIGSSYELVMVCPNDKWEGELGDMLRTVLRQPVDKINSYEPMFDLYRIANLTDLHRKNRNLMFVVTGPEYPQPALTAQYDLYAAPQLIISLSGPSDEVLTEYIAENGEYLRQVLESAERDRDIEFVHRYGDKTIERDIFNKFGVTVELPKGYKIRNTGEDFMWLSFEYPTASQGIVIYSYPYTDRENFTYESLLAYRNQFTALIPGENPGSHMTTVAEDGYEPDLRHLRLETGRYWAEMRGFWEVYNDFMGGPFVSYSTLDTDKNRVVTFDFYVYSPSNPKRNYLRQLEHIIYSVKFPSDVIASEGE